VFKLESQMTIHLGYKDDVGEVFSGEVTGFYEKLPEQGSAELTITGHNVLHRLDHAARYRNFEEKSLSDIIKGLIESYALQGEVEDCGAAIPFISEDEPSDYHYLIRYANAYGKQIFAHGNTIYVGNEITVNTHEVIYEWGKSLISFEGAQSMRYLVSGIDYIGWDPVNNESFVGSGVLADIPVKIGGSQDWTGISKGGSGHFRESRINLQVKDRDEAKQIAIGMLQHNSFHFGYAKGSGEGNYKLRPGMRVTIKMAGPRLEGEYRADMVTHYFDYQQGYLTSFILSRNRCL
jgi:phage protein D